MLNSNNRRYIANRPCPVMRGQDHEHALSPVDRVHLDHTLGQIHPYPHRSFSDNLVHGTSPFIGCRLMTSNTTNLGAPAPSPEGGKSLRIPIERTSQRPLRALCAAAHVER